jgi:hypothetical protein
MDYSKDYNYLPTSFFDEGDEDEEETIRPDTEEVS